MDTSDSEDERRPVRSKKMTKTRGTPRVRVKTDEQKEKARATSKRCRRLNILTKPDFLVNERKRSAINRKTIDQLTFAEAELRRKKQRRSYRKRKGLPDYDSSDCEETRVARDKRRARCKRDIKYKEERPKVIEVIEISSSSDIEPPAKSTPAVMQEPEYILVSSDTDTCDSAVETPVKSTPTVTFEQCENVKEQPASVPDTSATQCDADELCEQVTSSSKDEADLVSSITKSGAPTPVTSTTNGEDELGNEDTVDSSSKHMDDSRPTVEKGYAKTLVMAAETLELAKKLASLVKPGASPAKTG